MLNNFYTDLHNCDEKIDKNELGAELHSFNQSHLLHFWDDLTPYDKHKLLVQINNIDYKSSDCIFKQALNDGKATRRILDGKMEPIISRDFENSMVSSQQKLAEYWKIGLDNIYNGKIAVITMAGGLVDYYDWTDLMYEVSGLSAKYVSDLQAEKIQKLIQLASKGFHKIKINSRDILWCIMINENMVKYIESHFEENNYFGLNPTSVIFLKQHRIPCYDMQGRIILESTKKISLSPDGNGGLYKALLSSGTISTLIQKGVEYVHVYGFENLITKVADPCFMGFCIKKQADFGIKIVEKIDPN